MAHWQFADNLGLQAQIGFANKGTAYKEVQSNVYTKGQSTVNYVELAGLLKYKFNTDPFSAYALIGPSLGLGYKGRSEMATESDPTLIQTKVIDFNKSINNRYELSAIGGLGVEYTVRNTTFFLDGRYRA